MEAAEQTFDAINEMVLEDNIDHFITMGDNIYPTVADKPTQDEFKQMFDLFKRKNLKDLPIYAIRGNHDCYYDKQTWLELFKNESKWDVPYYYYAREVEIDDAGNKIGFLMIDSCLLLCSNHSFTSN